MCLVHVSKSNRVKSPCACWERSCRAGRTCPSRGSPGRLAGRRPAPDGRQALCGLEVRVAQGVLAVSTGQRGSGYDGFSRTDRVPVSGASAVGAAHPARGREAGRRARATAPNQARFKEPVRPPSPARSPCHTRFYISYRSHEPGDRKAPGSTALGPRSKARDNSKRWITRLVRR
jgi:hypothetical protein